MLITLILHKLYGQVQLQVRCSYKYIQKLNVMVTIAVAYGNLKPCQRLEKYGSTSRLLSLYVFL